MRFISGSTLIIAALAALTACGGSDDEPTPPTTIEDGDGSDAGTDGSDDDKDADPSDDDSGSPDSGDDEGDGGTGGDDSDGGDTDGGGDDDGGKTFDPSEDCEGLSDSAMLSSVALGEDCYYVTGEVTAEAKIAINPGVTVYLDEKATLFFSAGLIADGTDSAKIRFLAADATKPYGTVRVDNVSSVRHVEFKGGGADADAMFDFDTLGNSGPSTVSNVVFDDGHGTSCFRLTGFEATTVEALTFKGCSSTTYTLTADPEMLQYLTAENDYGASPKFLVRGLTVYSGLTFKDLGAVYIVKGALVVRGGDLNVEPGVEIQVDSMDFIELWPQPSFADYSFNAVGTEDKPIVFKAGPGGKWRGLKITGGKSQFEYVTIDGAKYTGSGDPAANFTVDGEGVGNITKSTLSNSDGYGLFKKSNGTLNASNNTFINNKLGDELRN